jgi:hypothetical protein
MSDKLLLNKHRPASSSTHSFSLEHANKALVYVRRIVADIVASYHRLVELRAERDRNTTDESAAQTHHLHEQIAGCADRLNRLSRELSLVGCVLKDWRVGVIDFPARLDGRRVWLNWHLGESKVLYWREEHEAFANRQTIATEAFAA